MIVRRSGWYRAAHQTGVLLILVLCCLLLLTGPVTANEIQAQATYQPPLDVPLSASSAIVIDTGRSRRLYAKNTETRLPIPAASKIMTALLACERLPLDTPITISNVAALAAAKESTGDGLILQTGDKYPFEYLLLRLVFYDSNAAALAIAEQISNVEERFVELMNARADALELSNTVFLNSTGDPVYEDPPIDPGDQSGENAEDLIITPKPRQYTTVSDMARLVAVAMNNQTFANVIRKDSEYLVLSGDTLVPMKSSLQAIWTLSENRITGAFYCERRERAYSVAVGRINDFNVIIVAADGNPGQRIGDLLSLTNSIESSYVQTSLVQAGELFTGYQEETSDGESFGLVFKRTVQYVHPVDDIFLMQTVQYLSYGPHHRPIESSMTVGQVVFQLKDGTVIAVDVGPDRQILSSITVLNQLLNSLQNNRNLFFVIMACGVFLCLLMLYQVIRRLLRLSRLVRFVLLERRSRR
ncbi:MAG: hypothetical protein SCM11_16395 [Bacillota bacterium]|nr:hypothetical protein [Bacillota bacterium]